MKKAIDYCVQGCFFLISQPNRILGLLFAGCIFRGHIYSSRMPCRKLVCRQAADAFVLRLHDVPGMFLKIIIHVLLLKLCTGELKRFLLLCHFSVDVCFWCFSEPRTGGTTRRYRLLRAGHVYPLLFPLSVFLDVY